MQRLDLLLEKIKARLQELMLDDKGVLMQLTHSFMRHVLSVTGLIKAPESGIEYTCPQNLTSAIYSEVGTYSYFVSLYIFVTWLVYMYVCE